MKGCIENERISRLIEIREELMVRLKNMEQREEFNEWKLVVVEDGCESCPDLSYPGVCKQLSEVFTAIEKKTFNLVLFTTDEIDSRENMDICIRILSELKNNPKLSREELRDRVHFNADMALDYLIEKDMITYRNPQKDGFWKVLKEKL